MPLTKAELAVTLCENIGLSLREAKDVVAAIYDVISSPWSPAIR